MDTRIERFESDHAIAINATIIHDGHEFTSGGGYVSPELVYAYVKPDGMMNGWETMGTITLWDGTEIGRYETVSLSRPRYSCFGNYRMRSIRAQINYGTAKGLFHGRLNDEYQLVTLRPYRKEVNH